MMTEEELNKEREGKNRWIFLSYFLVVIVLCFIAFLILYRAFNIAFVEKDKWLAIAEKQQQPNRLIPPRRGNIYSAKGELMATSVPRYYLYIDFKADCYYKPTKKWNSRDTLLHSKRNGIDSLSYYLSHKFKDRTPAGYKNYLLRGLKSGSRQYRIYPHTVSYLDMKELKTFPFLRYHIYRNGFYVKNMTERAKPFKSLAARTIGDVYSDVDPKTMLSRARFGLELEYDSLLRGSVGLKSVRRLGGVWTNVTEKEPVDGMDVRTTLDVQMQDITEKSLTDMLEKTDAASGTAVVMEVATGEIKAISNMMRTSHGYVESMNYAFSDMSEPGSTFKVPSIMVALEDGVCQPTDTVDVGNGVYMYGSARMTDHNAHRGGYGRIAVEQAIWFSSNIGVAKTILKGYKHNPTKYVEGLYRMGLNEDLHLQIPGSARAKIRMPNDSVNPWSRTTLPWMSFGYETQMPPIYMLTFYNAIANNGKMVQPMLVKSIMKDGSVVEKFSPTVVRESICSERTLTIIRDMLKNVVQKGTGKPVRSDIVAIAGKTGTAQIAKGGVYRVAGHQVTFCGYFPADNPKYSAIAVVRQPRNGYPSGGTMSGGIVKSIAEQIYATNIVYDLHKIDRDSLAVMMPKLKAGDRKATEDVLDELDIEMNTDSVETDWIHGYLPDSTQYVFKDIPIRDNLVPNVIGMGAKDAVYLLESSGLRVSLIGTGRVHSQSVRPGARISKGQTVLLTLR